WLQLEAVSSAPSGDPAWLQIEKGIVDTGAIPGKPLNVTGSAPTITTAQSVFGGSSLYMPGTGYALSTPDSPDWDLGGGDFTIEGRFRVAVVRKARFAQITPAGSDFAGEVTMDAGSVSTPMLTFFYATGSGTAFDLQVDRSFAANLNQWYHIAIVRSGQNLMHFVDGGKLGSSWNMASAVIRSSAAPLRIGGDAKTTGNDFNGWMEELRI